MEPQMEYARSWLCPDAGDRERLLDMDGRLRKARGIAMAFLAAALLVCGPWVGWWTIILLLATALAWALLDRRVLHSAKPEWVLATGWLCSIAAISAGVLLTGQAHSPAKSWLLVPAITLPARFHKRGLYAGFAITVIALAIVTIGVDPAEVAKAPQLFIFPAALIAASLALSMALRNAEIQHRSDSVIDQLTGMLNRKALEARTVELELQSRVSGQPVGLIVCDIDHFKSVNDTHGHAVGDVVLKELAYRLRKELRAYDLAYRMGGEEFVVLVPGASLEVTTDLAERLRLVIADELMSGIPVSASFGVASSPGGGLDFPALFETADEALYRAKASGRNRVCTADDPAMIVLA
jgi:diguanylate cyclase (GGDEF)-like protein